MPPPDDRRPIVVARVDAAASPSKAAPHEALDPILRRAFTGAGLDLDAWSRADRDHAAVLLAPPEVPDTVLTTALPEHLFASVRLHNSVRPKADRLSMRIDMHLGRDVEEAVGIVDAGEVDAKRRYPRHQLVLLLSDEFFRAAVAPNPDAEPSTYAYLPRGLPHNGVWVRGIDDLTVLRTPPSTSNVLDSRYDRLGSVARKLFRRASLVTGPVTGEVAAVLLPNEADDRLRDAGALLVQSKLMAANGDELYFVDPAMRRYAGEQLSAAEHPVAIAELRSQLRRRELAQRGAAPKARLVRDYWTTDDLLGYRSHADAIAAFLRHPDSRPPLTIGLRGPWGAGKTSLMRMVRAALDPPVDGKPRPIELTSRSRQALRRFRKRGAEVTNAELLRNAATPGDTPTPSVAPPDDGWRATVWFNPWTYQSSEQVWAGLAHAVVTQVTDRLRAGDRERFWLELNLARVDRLAIRRRAYRLILERLAPAAVGLLLTAVVAGILLLAGVGLEVARWVLAGGTAAAVVAGAAQYLAFRGQHATAGFQHLLSGPLAGPASGLLDSAFPDPRYADRAGFLHAVHEDMRRVLRLVATEERPLVVFVDDLDRCSPSGVAQVIEAINLFLAGEFENRVFVLAMEPRWWRPSTVPRSSVPRRGPGSPPRTSTRRTCRRTSRRPPSTSSASGTRRWRRCPRWSARSRRT